MKDKYIDLFDECEDKLMTNDANLNDQLTKVEKALDRLAGAGPINYPTAGDKDNKEFLKKVQDITFKTPEIVKILEQLKANSLARKWTIGKLDKALADLADLKKDAQKKLEIYKDLIKAALQNEGKQDPQLMGTLKKLEKEAEAIQEQLKEIDAKESEIKAKMDDARQMIDDQTTSAHSRLT